MDFSQFPKCLFWMDGGPAHFRTLELVGYFQTLYETKIFKKIKWNYFIEYHGKNICDSHFATISSIIKRYEYSVDSITSTNQLVNILQNGLKNSYQNSITRNENRKKQRGENPTQNFSVIQYSRESPTILKNICKIKNFKIYYSFKIEDDAIICKVLDTDTNFIKHAIIKKQEQKKQKNVKQASKITTSFSTLSNMKRKQEIKRQKISNESEGERIDLMDLEWETEVVGTGIVSGDKCN